MSAAILKKSLALVDADVNRNAFGKRKSKNRKNIFHLVPENQKLIVNKKSNKTNLLSTTSKLTVTEAKKNNKNKEQILRENLKKLELIKKVTTLKLDKTVTDKIIERAVTRRPIKTKAKNKQDKKTAFTEEDFKKFESEYFDE